MTLEHRHLDRAGDGWRDLRAAVGGEGGWQWVLERYASIDAEPATAR